MAIQKLNATDLADFVSLIEIFQEVFENSAPILNHHHLSQVLLNAQFLVFVVKVEQQVVGGLTIHVLPSYYDSKPMAFIYDVGISPPFQGQGWGKSLLAEACAYCRFQGFGEAFVEAESDDIDAIGFYRSTAFSSEMDAKQFTYRFDKG